MIVFAFVVLGFLAGFHVVRTLGAGKARTRSQELGLLGLLAAGAALGWLAWIDSRSEGAFTFVSSVFDDLHQVMGAVGDVVAAAMLIVTVVAVALGILAVAASAVAIAAVACAMAAAFWQALADAETSGRPPWFSELYGSRNAVVSPPAWEAGVLRYGRAAASALGRQAIGPVRLRVCGPHPAHLHIVYDHLVCVRVQADWDVYEGWSVRVGRERHRFGPALLPAPAEISRWVWRVASAYAARPGLSRPREWHAAGEAEAIRQAVERALARRKRPEIPEQPGSADDAEGTDDSA
ncbi:hypothetical protein [Amycolatopsis sp. VC5-11]|uniref:hypothetical protein n=1 Tax=Amycolatopsis sp. VC5-11 TaxID=3120156 RepID=UPI00300837AA